MARDPIKLAVKTCTSLKEWMNCHFSDPPSLSSLRGSFTELTRYFFSNPNNLADFKDALSCRTWSDDPAKRNINIEAGARTDPGDTENVPGITISLSEGINFQRAGLSNQTPQNPDFSSEANVYLATSKVQFVCRDYDANIAGMMADALLMFLVSIEQHLRQTYRWLGIYHPLNQTEPRREKKATDPEAFEDWYESVLTMELTYTYSTFTAIESKRLKDYSIEAVVSGGETTLDVPGPSV